MSDHRLEILLAARDLTQKAFDSFSGRVKSITNRIFSFQGAIATLAGTGGIGLLLKSSLDTADAIGKTADRIGISTGALQEYRYAAGLSGVETSKLDGGIQKFTKNLGEAKQETGTLVTFLKKYDEQLLKNIQNSKSTDDALDLIFNAMGRTEDAAGRAALANAAFGKSGIDMTVMVKSGAAGLAAMRQEAIDLGIVLEDDLIRNSEAANDSIARVSQVIKTNFQKTVLTLAPDITKIATGMTDWVKANKDLVAQDLAVTIDGISASASVLKETIVFISGAIEEYTARSKAYGMASAGNISWSQAMTSSFSELKDIFKNEELAAYKHEIQEISEEIAIITRSGGIAINAEFVNEETRAENRERLQELVDRMVVLRKLVADVGKENETASKKGSAGMNELANATGKGAAGMKGLAGATSETAGAIDDLTKKTKEEIEKELEALADRMAASFDPLKELTKNPIDISLDLDFSSSLDDSDPNDPFGVSETTKQWLSPAGEFATFVEERIKEIIAAGITAGVAKGPKVPEPEVEETLLYTYENMIRDIQNLNSDMIGGILDGTVDGLKEAGNLLLDHFKGLSTELTSKYITDIEKEYFDDLADILDKKGKTIKDVFKKVFSDINGLITSVFSTNPYLLLLGGIVAGGYALSESMSGSDAVDTWKYAGEGGTVFGDLERYSESMSNSLDLLNEVNVDSFSELQGIRSGILELNSNITGLVLSIVHGSVGTFTAGNLGIEEGRFQASVFDDIGKVALNEFFGGGATTLLSNLFQQMGGSFGNLVNWFGGGKKSKKLETAGIQTGGISIEDLLSGEGVDTSGFARIKVKKTGLFGSSKTWFKTEEFDLEDSVTSMFTSVFENLGKTMLDLAKGLGTDNLEEVTSYIFDVSKIDLKDLSGEEVSEKISAWVSEQGDLAAQALFGELVTQYQRLDEGMLETVTRLVVDRESVLAAVEKTGYTFAGTAKEAIAFSETIIDLAGDLGTLNTITQTYYDAFFTETEKFADLTADLSESITDLGVTLPDTRQGFRDLVDGLDRTTSSGQELFVGLMKLAGGADEYYKTLESRTERDLQTREDIGRYIADITGSATDLDKALLGVDDRFEGWLSKVDEGTDLWVWVNDQWQIAIDATRESFKKAEGVIVHFGDTLNDRITMQSLQNKILGLGGDEIRMAEIAAKYGWAENGYASMNPDGTYNWGIISQRLNDIAGMSTDEAAKYFERIADVFGLSVDMVIDDFGYLSDAVWSFADAADKAAREISDIYFSDLAPVRSAGMYDFELSKLMSSAGSGRSEDIDALFEFVKSDYLPFYQGYTGGGSDYNTVFQDVMDSLSQFSETGFDLPGAIEDVGTTVADAIRTVYANEVIPLLADRIMANPTINVDGRVLGDIVAQQMETNSNLIEAMRR